MYVLYMNALTQCYTWLWWVFWWWWWSWKLIWDVWLVELSHSFKLSACKNKTKPNHCWMREWNFQHAKICEQNEFFFQVLAHTYMFRALSFSPLLLTIFYIILFWLSVTLTIYMWCSDVTQKENVSVIKYRAINETIYLCLFVLCFFFPPEKKSIASLFIHPHWLCVFVRNSVKWMKHFLFISLFLSRFAFFSLFSIFVPFFSFSNKLVYGI